MPAKTTSAMLYLNGVSVSFEGFRALTKLSLAIERVEIRSELVEGPFISLARGFYRWRMTHAQPK